MSVRSSALAFSLLLATTGGAQVVQGTITDRQTTGRVGGVVVLLLDASDSPVARALSSASGEFRLAAPGAGPYRIRTLRIGFRPSTTDVIELAAGREVTRDLEVAMIPFLLDTVKSGGRNACRDRSGTDVASAVWEQARTALYATQISSRLRAIDATLQSYERIYNPGSSRIREQSARSTRGFTTAAWVSLPADSLHRAGYVVEDGDGWSTFYAPDVNVLLSRAFQAEHCFRIARTRDSSLTGLSFEPVRDRGVSDIKGTIWLETKTSDLRRFEFRYTGVAPIQEDEAAGGQMEFSRMRNGGFAISRWSIRMPVVRLVELTGVRSQMGNQARLAEVRVAGGDLVSVTLGGDTLWTRPGLSVTGIVTDSASGERVGLAHVSLAGTPLKTTADSRGRFEIPDVLPGEYTLEVRTPSLDSMNAVHQMVVTVEDGAKPLSVRVARADQLARALCSFDRSFNRASPPGIVLGTSRLTGDSLPPRNVLIAAEWVERQLRSEGGSPVVTPNRRWKETRTDAKGEFRICGVPTGTAITINAGGDSAEAAPVVVTIAEGRRFERTELVFDRVAVRSAILAGTVMIDSTDGGIPDVEVSFPALKRSMLTNDAGRFRFADVPPGEHQLVVRRVGYGPLDTRITLAPGQTMARRIYLTKVPILEVVEVEASRLPPEFDENRRLGLGHFFTRAELAKLEHVSLPGVLAQLPQLAIVSIQDPVTRAYISTVGTRRVVKQQSGSDLSGFNPLGCIAQIYIDKFLFQDGARGPFFNLRTLQPDDVEAIQWYNNKLQMPAEYNRTGSECGVLVIHTRKAQ